MYACADVCVLFLAVFGFRRQCCVKRRFTQESSRISLEERSQWRSSAGSVTTSRSEPTVSSPKREFTSFSLINTAYSQEAGVQCVCGRDAA